MVKTISVIGSAGIPNRYGGFETLAENLVSRLQGEFKFIVYCSGFLYKKKERNRKRDNTRCIYIPLPANGIFSIPYDCIGIFHAVKRSDLLLILGVSGALVLPLIRLFTGKKIIVHVDGIEWKRKKWNMIARIYLYFSTKTALIFSHKIILDNRKINEMYCFPGNKVNIIEYGGDHVESSVKIKPQDLPDDFFLGIARIEPENNIDMILNAFRKIPDRNMVMIGNWNNTVFGRKLKKKFQKDKNIILCNAIYDQVLLNSVRSETCCYIHGHSAGGSNPSLIEAMWLKKPILCFDSVFNRETLGNFSLFFRDEEELVSLIKSFRNRNNIIPVKETYDLAGKKYRWDRIIREYKKVFTFT